MVYKATSNFNNLGKFNSFPDVTNGIICKCCQLLLKIWVTISEGWTAGSFFLFNSNIYNARFWNILYEN